MRACESVLNCVKVCESVRVCLRECGSVWEYIRVCESVLESVIWERESVRAYKSVCECA